VHSGSERSPLDNSSWETFPKRTKMRYKEESRDDASPTGHGGDSRRNKEALIGGD